LGATFGGERFPFFSLDPGAFGNTAFGSRALSSQITGLQNTAVGEAALSNTTSGNQNVAVGAGASVGNSTGSANTAIGAHTLGNLMSGDGNIAIGHWAGLMRLSGDFNIDIGTQGVDHESNTIRIGSVQTRTFVAGIRDVATGINDAVAVMIDSEGQLGTINSSRRFKEDIQPMGSVSDRLLALRPVTFRYIEPYQDGSKPMQFGLIAEDVAEVFPELVVYGKDGNPQTVAYHLLTPLLLNELQKEQAELQKEKARTAALQRQLDEQGARLAALSERVDEVKVLKAQIEELKRLAIAVQVAERVQ
jgi:hypothetical protein